MNSDLLILLKCKNCSKRNGHRPALPPSQNPLRASQEVRTPAPRQAVVLLRRFYAVARGSGSYAWRNFWKFAKTLLKGQLVTLEAFSGIARLKMRSTG